MTEINYIEPMKIDVISKDTFSIGDTRNYKDYISGGIVKEVFIPIKKFFFGFKQSFFDPFHENLRGQSIKRLKRELFHVSLISLHHFYDIHNFLSQTNNEEHILEIIKTVEFLINFENKDWIKKIKIIDKKYL